MNRLISILLASALALGGCSSPAVDNATAAADQPPLAGARIGGPFTLTDQNGRTVTQADLAGKYAIVYFGYSFCPDICPVDLQNIAAGLRAFERTAPQRAARIQPVFVTIDPARDTQAVLKTYAAAFHPRLLALTGTPEQVAAAAKGYGIYYAKAPNSGASEYLMDHSRQAYLFGPDGKPMALLPSEKSGDAVAGELQRWVT